MRDFIKIFILATFILTCGAAVAEEGSDFIVVPGIDLAFKQSSLNVVLKNGTANENLRPSYITIIPSVLMAYGKLYAALSYDTPLTEHHEISTKKEGGDYLFEDRSYLREEATLTLGYRVLPALSLFTGYIRGESKLRFHKLKYNGTTTTPEASDVYFTTRGYFAGLSTSRNFEGKGTLALSAAYTSLNGTFTDSSSKGRVESSNSLSASGYSTGVSWSGELSDSFFYQVGYRYAKYYYDFVTTQIEEPVKGLTFGIRKYF